jgi:hypothetical protein
MHCHNHVGMCLTCRLSPCRLSPMCRTCRLSLVCFTRRLSPCRLSPAREPFRNKYVIKISDHILTFRCECPKWSLPCSIIEHVLPCLCIRANHEETRNMPKTQIHLRPQGCIPSHSTTQHVLTCHQVRAHNAQTTCTQHHMPTIPTNTTQPMPQPIPPD